MNVIHINRIVNIKVKELRKLMHKFCHFTCEINLTVLITS